MSKMTNIKKVPFEIATILAQNSKIQKLLLDNNADVLTTTSIQNQEGDSKDEEFTFTANDLINQKYIWLSDPILEYATQNFDHPTILIISIEEVNLYASQDNIAASGAIFVITDRNSALLENNKLRAWELADEVEKEINDRKLSAAGRITISSIYPILYSKFTSGIRINFSIKDYNKTSFDEDDIMEEGEDYSSTRINDSDSSYNFLQ